MIYLQLLWSFFQIGLFSIGGGYAAMPLIQSQIVDLHHWLTMGEFADVITISQMTPGPIAINSASFVGIRIAGIPGALVATLGCVLPSCIIVLLLAKMYYKYRSISVVQGVLEGLRPAVVAMIASAGLSIMALAFFKDAAMPTSMGDTDFAAMALFGGCLIALRKTKLDPVLVMMGAGVIGLIIYNFI